jgi:sulfatase modifying factor 1
MTCPTHLRLILPLVLSVAALSALPAHGAAPEVLPNGNLRDPMPDKAALDELVRRSKANLAFFPGGSFDMGDWGTEVGDGLPYDGTLDSKPLHKVTLDGFSIGKYPVTYAEFDLFTAAQRLPRINQDWTSEKYRKLNNPAGTTWEGAKAYCRWLGKLSGLPFDLPTEAQWEYAARSGGQRYVYPTDSGELEEGRNIPSYEQRKAAGGLVRVGSFPPNPAGIYDMSAGFHEWVNDWYDPQYYKHSPESNPKGPVKGKKRVVRGHFGDGGSQMTFKRWSDESKEQTGTWTQYDDDGKKPNREIPYTKYSSFRSDAFRCAVHRSKPEQ